MAVEISTTIPGLNALWPLGSDAKSEGDDHLRLIKSVLQAEFPKGAGGLTPATAQARNRIVNGAMQISQEFGSTSTATAGAYPVDQWSLGFSGIPGVAAGRSPTTTPDNSPWGVFTATSTVKASLAAGDYWYLQQPIEGIRVADFLWGTAGAKKVIVRFNIWNGGAAGTFCLSLQNGAGNRSWVGSFAAPAGWSKQALSIPGDTGGTWPKDNSKGISLIVGLAAGSTYVAPGAGWNGGNFFGLAGMSNAAAATTGFYIADVGLYLDPNNTGLPPAWQLPDEATELIACQRYWNFLDNIILAGNTGAGLQLFGSHIFPVDMRTQPAITFTNVSYTNCSALTNNGASNKTIQSRVNQTAAGQTWCVFVIVASARM